MKTKYSLVIFYLLCYLFVCLGASGQHLRFAKVYSNLTQNYIANIGSLQTDQQGNYIMAGSVSGYYGSQAIYFGADSFINSTTAFVSGLDSTGVYKWAIPAGIGLSDPFSGGSIPAIVCDKQNRAYLLGYYDSTTRIADTVIRGINGGDNIFLARLGTDGSLIWIKNIVAGGEFYPTALHEDRFGNLLVTGYNLGSAKFGSTVLSTNIVLAKFDSAGTQLWAKSYGEPTGLGYQEQGNSISTDYNGNIYLVGLYRNLYDRFDSVGLAMPMGNSTLSEYAGFTAKFSPNGVCQWAKTNGCFAVSIATDSAGNSYTAGNGMGAFDTANTFFYNYSCFICKHNANGHLEFVKLDSTNAHASQNITSLALDDYGNCYAAGFKIEQFHLDSAVTGAACHNISEYDAFLLALNPAGRLMWLQSNCNSSALGRALVVNKCNVAYAGVFQNYNDSSAFEIDGTIVPNYARDSTRHSNADFFLVSFDTCVAAYVDTMHMPSAVSNINGLERISIYPNPATDLCTILISNYSGEKYNVTISDITGKEVSPVFTFTDSYFTFPVSQFSKGMYILKITANDGKETLKKLVIN